MWVASDRVKESITHDSICIVDEVLHEAKARLRPVDHLQKVKSLLDQSRVPAHHQGVFQGRLPGQDETKDETERFELGWVALADDDTVMAVWKAK